MQVVVEALWQELLAEVERVSREIERDNQGDFIRAIHRPGHRCSRERPGGSESFDLSLAP